MSPGESMPDANPAFAILPYAFGRTSVAERDPGLRYPFFVKPVKAAYSVLARRVDGPDDLQRHLTFHPWETHIIKRLVRPFAELMRDHEGFDVDVVVLPPFTALRSVHAPTGRIRPLSSSTLMKRSGATMPRPGQCQRISASTPVMRPVARLAFGW